MKSPVSSACRSASAKGSTTPRSALASAMTVRARSGSLQKSAAAERASSSFSRVRLPATSKIPPHLGQAARSPVLALNQFFAIG